MGWSGEGGGVSLAEDAEIDSSAPGGIVQQQGGGDGGVDGPQHGDEQRGDDLRAGHQLPDAHADGEYEQEVQDAVEPQVARRVVLQLALACMGFTLSTAFPGGGTPRSSLPVLAL